MKKTLDNICKFNLFLIFMYHSQIEWRCAKKGDGLQVFVDNIEVPVTVGNDNLTHLIHN